MEKEKQFIVCVRTTFNYYKIVKAKNEQDARNIVDLEIDEGSFDFTDTEDVCTEIEWVSKREITNKK